MRKLILLFAILILSAVSAYGQVSSRPVRYSNGVPTTCARGYIYVNYLTGKLYTSISGVCLGAGVGGDALTTNPLSQFAATTSAQLAGVLSDETGTGGGFVRSTSPSLVTPTLGVASATSLGTSGNIQAGASLISAQPIYFGAVGALKSNLDGRNDGIVKIATVADTGATISTPANSPAQITADQNNYNPGSSSMFLRLSTDASRSITGLTFTVGKFDGQTHHIVNVGSNPIVLVNESASSTAANRFHNSTGADITLSADQAADLFYDSTTARWRVFKRN